jgi:hypothetical protein
MKKQFNVRDASTYDALLQLDPLHGGLFQHWGLPFSEYVLKVRENVHSPCFLCASWCECCEYINGSTPSTPAVLPYNGRCALPGVTRATKLHFIEHAFTPPVISATSPQASGAFERARRKRTRVVVSDVPEHVVRLVRFRKLLDLLGTAHWASKRFEENEKILNDLIASHLQAIVGLKVAEDAHACKLALKMLSSLQIRTTALEVFGGLPPMDTTCVRVFIAILEKMLGVDAMQTRRKNDLARLARAIKIWNDSAIWHCRGLGKLFDYDITVEWCNARHCLRVGSFG